VQNGKRVGAVIAAQNEVGIGVNTPDQKIAATALFEEVNK
jgi:hypothetical protein